MPKNAAAIAHIRELCGLGLAGELLIPAVLEALHRVIASARNLFDWVDGDGSIRRYYFEGPIDHRLARLYFDEFHNRREAEAMPRFVDVIRGETTIRSAEELNHAQFFDSALYNEIWRPQRLHYRLEAIVRGRDGKALGSLVLYREHGDAIFSHDDEQTLRLLVPYVAHGLQHETPQQIDYAAGDRREVLVNLDAQGRIVHLSRHAHKVLMLAHGGISPDAAARAPTSEDFPTLVLLHRQLTRAAAAASAAAPFVLTLSNAWGEFRFSAEAMESVDGSGAALVGVAIRHLEPREVRDLNLLEASNLSIGQKKACALLLSRKRRAVPSFLDPRGGRAGRSPVLGALRGCSHAQIAQQLRVSPYTATDYIRKIYLKLDVHSVEELQQRLRGRSAPLP